MDDPSTVEEGGPRFMGFIPREVIRGKALFIYYSIDPFINRPFPRFLTAVRWDRLGMIIR